MEEKSIVVEDVEGHAAGWSDETLKEAIKQAENSLAALRKLESASSEEADVEGHLAGWSDETLKEAIKQAENSLAALRKLESASSK